MDTETARALTFAALPVVELATAFIRSQVGCVDAAAIETKERNSLVSYVDKKAEEILVHGLGKILPDAGFLTEEDTVENEKRALTWIIDPLDGTTNFLQSIPYFAVSVALVDEGDVVVGIVTDIMHDHCYRAWLGGGAWRDDEQIRVSPTTALRDAILATGFPYHAPNDISGLVDILRGFLAGARGVRRLGAAALDLTYVACGKLDGFYETGLNPWDIAAGTLLVREAGGSVSDFDGLEDFVENRTIVASNGHLHAQMLKVLAASAPLIE